MQHDALNIKNLRKVYKNGTRALNGIDLSVADRDFFALLGPNGAGKSTLLGIVSSGINKSSGSVRIYGHDLDTDSFNAKCHLGIAPQEFNINVFEKVADVLVMCAQYYGMTVKQAKAEVDKHLELLGLGNKRNTQVRTLSGGMKRRLMIARALMHSPKLLILDEPTAGVDIEIRHQMWKFLNDINKSGVTIVLTTHYLEEAEQLCRNIAIIDKGEILLTSSIKDLLGSKHKKTFVLDISAEAHVPESLPNISIQRKDPNTVEVQIDADTDLNTLFEVLGKHRIDVKNIRGKSNRLEELFLSLTGK